MYEKYHFLESFNFLLFIVLFDNDLDYKLDNDFARWDKKLFFDEDFFFSEHFF